MALKSGFFERDAIHERISRVLDGPEIEGRRIVAASRELEEIAGAFRDGDEVVVCEGGCCS